jgi:hypothetical protein
MSGIIDQAKKIVKANGFEDSWLSVSLHQTGHQKKN